MLRGDPIHGERIVDGDASTLTALSIFDDGETDTRTLADDEAIYVTDVMITSESGGDIFLVADAAAAGKYIFAGNLDAKDTVVMSFSSPYRCPLGVVPKFAGGGSDKNSCIIQGFIVKS